MLADMSKSRRIQVSKLRPGMRFNFIPAAWHGVAQVLDMRDSGHLVRVEFANDQIVNPPGVSYRNPLERVRVYPKRKNKG
jgi:hypothetical protein